MRKGDVSWNLHPKTESSVPAAERWSAGDFTAWPWMFHFFRFAGDVSEYGEDGELFVCETFRKMEFYSLRDIAKAKSELPPMERYKQLYADSSENKLRKIVQSESYQDEAKRAAQILLNETFK